MSTDVAFDSSPGTGSSMSWYLVHTKPRQEAVAALNLQRQGYPCYLPMLTLDKLRRSRIATVTEPMFPRYLFVQLDSAPNARSWAPIRSTLGVTQLVHFGNRPARVDDALIGMIREREHSGPPAPGYQAGDKVVVTAGPFAGVEAIFESADAQRRCMILIEILSRPVPLSVPAAGLRSMSRG